MTVALCNPHGSFQSNCLPPSFTSSSSDSGLPSPLGDVLRSWRYRPVRRAAVTVASPVCLRCRGVPLQLLSAFTRSPFFRRPSQHPGLSPLWVKCPELLSHRQLTWRFLFFSLSLSFTTPAATETSARLNAHARSGKSTRTHESTSINKNDPWYLLYLLRTGYKCSSKCAEK